MLDPLKPALVKKFSAASAAIEEPLICVAFTAGVPVTVTALVTVVTVPIVELEALNPLLSKIIQHCLRLPYLLK